MNLFTCLIETRAVNWAHVLMDLGPFIHPKLFQLIYVLHGFLCVCKFIYFVCMYINMIIKWEKKSKRKFFWLSFKRVWMNLDVCFGLLSYWKTTQWHKARLTAFLHIFPQNIDIILAFNDPLLPNKIPCVKEQNIPPALCSHLHASLWEVCF